jgi:uncharacterized protein (DUF2267 family)
MTVGSVDSVERTVHKANEWMNELTHEMGIENRETAWRVLRGYLQVLRDRLTIDEGAQLAAQLPQLLRGAFYEGFDPGHQPAEVRDRDDFLALLAERAELGSQDEAATAAAAATRVLRNHITGGEFDDILSEMPAEIRGILQNA